MWTKKHNWPYKILNWHSLDISEHIANLNKCQIKKKKTAKFFRIPKLFWFPDANEKSVNHTKSKVTQHLNQINLPIKTKIEKNF